MSEGPAPGSLPLGVYRHYRGQFYLVLGVARLDLGDQRWDDEPAVVYVRLYGRSGVPMSVRPLKSFVEEVAPGRPRFTWVGHVDPRSAEPDA